MMKKNSNDHWDFLEEIEAPMWVDLLLQANINNQDGDDDWFYRSHLLRFLILGEESAALNFNLLGPSSPKLPSSVSRSRGKNYVSKKWREDTSKSSSIGNGRPSCYKPISSCGINEYSEF
ncbi:hypothetical protein M0R45_015008 [Rubus argutus]|uniref:Uncharacterized protein n=1 Tax=Rubus argutus TaxID=59490 RepID=A0AAW1XNF2_RUBAR